MSAWIKTIFAIVLAAAMASCGTTRRITYTPVEGLPGSDREIAYGEMSSEEFIMNEFLGLQDQLPAISRMLMQEAYSWRGTPYVYGGKTHSGTDCSGFTMMVFLNALEIQLPRNSAKQAEACREIGKSELQPGDLVFFHGGNRSRGVSHVGIYVGNNRMLHASGSRGVIESDLGDDYYLRHYHHCGRVVPFERLLKKESKFTRLY